MLTPHSYHAWTRRDWRPSGAWLLPPHARDGTSCRPGPRAAAILLLLAADHLPAAFSAPPARLPATRGYDCVAHPGGLLARVYRQLRMPRTRWRGLQALPSVAPHSADDTFRSMVRSLIAVLDPELAAALPPRLPRPPAAALAARRNGYSPPRFVGASGSGGHLVAAGATCGGNGAEVAAEAGSGQPPAPAAEASGGSSIGSPAGLAGRQELPGDALFDGLLSDGSDDEDWRADLARERALQARLEAQAAAAARAAISPRSATTTTTAGGAAADGLAQSFQEQASLDGGSGGPGTPAREASPTKARPPRPPSPPLMEPSRRGVAAMLALLQCCVGEPAPGEGGDDCSAGSSPGGSPHAGGGSGLSAALLRGPPPRVRWYDARARVALKAVAAWLYVSTQQLATLEVLLTSDKAPAAKGYTPAEEDSWDRKMRFLKVGGVGGVW